MGDYENQRNYRSQGQLVGSREQKNSWGTTGTRRNIGSKGDHVNQGSHKIKGDQ